MSDPTSPTPKSVSSIQATLHQLSQALRQTHHLDLETQEALAGLMDELANALHPSTASPETAQLAQSAAHLAHALHQRHDQGVLAAAKERLENAALRAEVSAPLATGVARRLIETLANLGI
jgi:hypothetical protein